jgi:hypothetical protein
MLENEINQFNSILKKNSFKKAKFNKDQKKKPRMIKLLKNKKCQNHLKLKKI